MAKNTYKKKPDRKEEEWIKNNFLTNRRLHLFIGFSLLLISIFLTVSFISYFNTGQADQSVVEASTRTHIEDSGREVQNAFGLIGAISSYYFIFLGFGIASILIPPLLFTIACRIIWFRSLIPIGSAFNFTVFYLIWISTLMGYILLIREESSFLEYLSGGIGYELATIAHSLMGWGTILFLIFLFIIFNMLFFNITRIPALSNIGDQILDLIGSIELSIPKKTEAKPDLTSVINRVRKEVEDEEANKDETEEWIVKSIPPTAGSRRANPKPAPEFTIDFPKFKETSGLPKEAEEKIFASKVKHLNLICRRCPNKLKRQIRKIYPLKQYKKRLKKKLLKRLSIMTPP